jgi:hypothetical protein
LTSPGQDVTPAILAATRLEASAARRALPGWHVVRTGISCSEGLPEGEGPALVVGLCGALVPLAPGTVSIPDEISLAGEAPRSCDPGLTALLVEGARRLGLEPVRGPMLTAPAMVTGPEREVWAGRGFETVDMEAGLILARRPGAVVRVVLDTPAHELSPGWEHPLRALVRPGRWPQLAWLARMGPAGSRRSTAVVRAAFVP